MILSISILEGLTTPQKEEVIHISRISSWLIEFRYLEHPAWVIVQAHPM